VVRCLTSYYWVAQNSTKGEHEESLSGISGQCVEQAVNTVFERPNSSSTNLNLNPGLSASWLWFLTCLSLRFLIFKYL
jgi:hypothetical protein